MRLTTLTRTLRTARQDSGRIIGMELRVVNPRTQEAEEVFMLDTPVTLPAVRPGYDPATGYDYSGYTWEATVTLHTSKGDVTKGFVLPLQCVPGS